MIVLRRGAFFLDDFDAARLRRGEEALRFVFMRES